EAVSAAAPGGGTIAIGEGRVEGMLAAITLVELHERERIRGSTLFWLPVPGELDASAGTVASALGVAADMAAAGTGAETPDERESAGAAAVLEPVARRVLRTAHAARWRTDATPAARKAIRRLSGLGREAARRRDAPLLEQVDRALRVAGRGHTAGEELLLASLEAAPTRELAASLASLPQGQEPRAFEARIIGAILFRSS